MDSKLNIFSIDNEQFDSNLDFNFIGNIEDEKNKRNLFINHLASVLLKSQNSQNG